MNTAAAASLPVQHLPAPGNRPVRVWLYIVALMILAMVVVGGATRLTNSGLSITEWQPIHGVIPPLNEAEWQEEFAKYQTIPEYQLINKGMSLDEFKGIFWWEWAHRLLGRVIGVVVLLPMLFFFVTRRIDRKLAPKVVAIFLLGAAQGAIGWWMVASGLSERTDVSQYRLAVHLTFACAIYAFVLWVARSLSPPAALATAGLRRVAGLIVAVVFLQIFLGGLVAGLNAGLTFNTWPLMDGTLVPSGLLIQAPAWRNFFENVATVQFDHRLVAYCLFALTIAHALQARGTPYARRATLLALLVTLQAGLGITTLLLVVPLHLAIAHQLGAVIVLGAAVLHLRAMGRPMPAADAGRPAPAAGRAS